MNKKFMIISAFLVSFLPFSVAFAEESEIETFFVASLGAKFQDAPAISPERVRRTGQSADHLYLIELVGKPKVHTVTIISGVTKSNVDDVLDTMAQSVFIFTNLPTRPWLQKAAASAMNGKPMKTSLKGGATMEMTSMMPTMPTLSLVIEKPAK